MLSIALATVLLLAFSWCAQFSLCLAYARALRSTPTDPSPHDSSPDGPWPRIGVIMTLRGADPFLPQAIRSVLDHPYPKLQLRIVVDHETDFALPIVQGAITDVDPNRFQISILRDRSPERSLVTSSLIQAVDEAGDEFDLLTFCAADMVVPQRWYFDLARAMSEPGVGSTLGNRWYLPTEGRWGSLIRQAWNAGAAVLMWRFEIPWGGAAAIRPQVLRESGLRAGWETSLVEDVPIYSAVRRAGMKLKFVPALTVVNREEIDVTGSFRFLRRQMIWARLYHPRWWLVVGHALSGGLAMVGPLVGALVAAGLGDPPSAAWFLGGWSIYLAGVTALWVFLERAMRELLTARGDEMQAVRASDWPRMAGAVFATQLLYPLAVIACCFARHIDWRGIRYRILGRGRARMLEYKPFAQLSPPGDGVTSI